MSEIHDSQSQFISMWKRLAGEHVGADLTQRDGLAMRWAENPFPFWNALFLTEQLDDAAQLSTRLVAARNFMKDKKQSGLVYVCEDYLSAALKKDLVTIAERAGLAFALPLAGMTGNILPFSDVQAHPTLTFKRVDSEAMLQVYADINSASYDFPIEAGRAGLAGSDLWKSTAYAYVGYDNGTAVSTSAVIVNDGQLYLALVATRPDAQRRGFGEATVRHALQCAFDATGLTQTSLHATDAGAPVYARIGYHTVTRFLAFMVA